MPRLSKIGAACLAAFGWTSGSTVDVSYLVVAGGGGGGGQYYAGGGGAGGYLTGTTSLNPTQSYTVTVGAGGASVSARGSSGTNSQFGTLTAAVGGGGGGANAASGQQDGATGGSGGGGSSFGTATTGNGGSGTSGQGNAGGTGNVGSGSNVQAAGGGGGGANATTGTGGNASVAVGGNGGNGTASSISGSSVTYAGGGGGGVESGTAGTGGAGGGGNGQLGTGTAATAGTANLGGGGGGSGYNASGGQGGSGVVIISYVGAQQFGGGIVTSSGGNTIHTFQTSGTLSPLSSVTANFLVVAGGGGGGRNQGGGGGAGGLRSSVTATGGGGSLESALTIDTNSIYIVTVGGAGAGGTSATPTGGSGSNSVFFSITSTGGGGGGPENNNGVTGGSGGGGGRGSTTGGSGTANQGFGGGNGSSSGSIRGGAGGGGANQVGASTSSDAGGNGGNGVSVSITGSSVPYAGGGGGGAFETTAANGGSGGSGGGGAGRGLSNTAGSSGTINTGGGGGGACGNTGFTDALAGGSGIVIISYASATQLMAGGTVTISGGNVIHTFTSSGYLAPIYSANNSLRFRKSANGYLSRTMNASSTTYTVSAWVKRGLLSGYQYIFASGPGTASNDKGIAFDTSTNQIYVWNVIGQALSTAVFRDPAAWYHVVMSVNSGTATVYVNNVNTGISQSSMSLGTYGRIGRFNDTSSANDFDGYMTEFNLIDGLALTPNSFGTANSYGVWQPITYGGSYGTNGFYLPFTGGSSFYGSFNGSSQYLQATLPATLTGAFTVESFFYRSGSGNNYIFTLGDSNTSTGLEYYIGTTGTVNVVYSSSAQISTSSNVPVANAWNHVAITRDSSNVVRLFVNGVQAGGIWTTTAAFSSTLRIGVEFFSSSITGYVNGGLSNFRVVNGTALYTSNFVPPTSALTAVSGTAILTLQSSTIIDNSGNSLSITNNGTVVTSQAYPFTMLGNQSKDYSPQGNNWTNNNIGVLAGSTLDIMTDVPTLTSTTVANYCTLNAVLQAGGYTLNDGNLNWARTGATGGGSDRSQFGTIGVTSGKWYWEFTAGTTNANSLPAFGIAIGSASTQLWAGSQTGAYIYNSDGTKTISGTSSSYGSSFTTGDIIGVAFDADAGTLTFYNNNTSQGTAASGLTSGPYFPAVTRSVGGGGSNGTEIANFGQRPFAYTPPTNFLALNTFNL